MWQKTRSIWGSIYDSYLEGFDYFYLCGDDTHLIVEDLRNVLNEMNIKKDEPLYLGMWVPAEFAYFAWARLDIF